MLAMANINNALHGVGTVIAVGSSGAFDIALLYQNQLCLLLPLLPLSISLETQSQKLGGGEKARHTVNETTPLAGWHTNGPL